MNREHQISTSTKVAETSTKAQIKDETNHIYTQPKPITHCISPLVSFKYNQLGLSIMY